jgi:hypothetical protein
MYYTRVPSIFHFCCWSRQHKREIETFAAEAVSTNDWSKLLLLKPSAQTIDRNCTTVHSSTKQLLSKVLAKYLHSCWRQFEVSTVETGPILYDVARQLVVSENKYTHKPRSTVHLANGPSPPYYVCTRNYVVHFYSRLTYFSVIICHINHRLFRILYSGNWRRRFK